VVDGHMHAQTGEMPVNRVIQNLGCARTRTLCLAFLVAAGLKAQQPDIRTGVSLVVAPVSVTDRKGAPIEALESKDFLVLVDGKPQRFELDEPVAPLSLVVAGETSDLAAAALAKLRKVGSLLEPVLSGQNGDVAVVTFNAEVRVVRAFGAPVSPRDAFAALKPGPSGGVMLEAVMLEAVMLEAVMESTRLLATRPVTVR